MKKLKLFYICIFIFTCHFVQAQEIYKETTIYMTDGSVYKGQILSEDAFEIELKTAVIDIIHIPKNHILNRHDGNDFLLVPGGKYHKKKGQFLSVDLSLNLGADNDFQQLGVVFGKRITSKINVGAGTSVTWTKLSDPTIYLLHTFVQPHVFGRYYINDKKWRLFTDIKLGYGIEVRDWQESSDGIYINPSIGFEIANRKNLKWTFKLSQFIQNTTADVFWQDSFGNPVEVESNIWYNRTAFTVGINF